MAELKAAWMQRTDLAQLVEALGAENVRWVGGAVRDTLLGLPVKDIDAATPLTPDEVMARHPFGLQLSHRPVPARQGGARGW